jgi:flagellar M-ring protein FliF
LTQIASREFAAVNGILQSLRNLGAVRLGAIGAALIGMAVFFVVLTNRISTPEMALLFSDLDLKDSGQIVQKLETMNVPYELRAQGAQIMVPSDQVMKLRLQLAEQGMPHGGSVGYEIFDKPDNFGPSQFVENINKVRALEGELERTIASISIVQSARVHLVLPQRELFSRERQDASASVVIKQRGAERLARPQVAAIQHLVAAAVPGLTVDRVSIVDSNGNLLARGDGNSADPLSPANSEEMRVNEENRLARGVEDLLERSLGPGKARVDVRADMDFDRITTNSESYDPDGQVVRSTQTTNQSDSNTNPNNAVSVTTNLPNGQTPAGAGSQSRSARNEETVNYEISKTVKSQVRDQGTVQRLSVAVLVDGTTTVGADGTKTYHERTPDEMKQLTALVRSAIGFDEKRGDLVEVVNMPFAGVDEPATQAAPWSMMGLEKPDLIRVGETGVVAIVGLLFLLLVVRPMVVRLIESLPAPTPAAAAGFAAGPGLATALAGPDGAGALAVQRTAPTGVSEMIDIGQVEGRVAASSMKKIGEIVEKHPEEAVSIMRSWMYQNNR